MTITKMPAHFRRNFVCLTLDFCFFGIALAFVGQSTVIPGLLTDLGASTALIGLMSTLQRAGWLLPQLVAARYVASKPLKKPYILVPGGISRPLLLVIAALLWATHGEPRQLVIGLVMGLMTLFWVGDGLASLPWFDFLSKAIPPQRRGRLTGAGQVLSGLFGFAAGFAVEWLLGKGGPAFPGNYAVLFSIAFAMLAGSWIAISLGKEEAGCARTHMPRWRDYVPQLLRVVRQDQGFRQYLIARQVFNLSALAAPFYMTYALEELGYPSQVAGRYTSIGVVGAILAAILFGWANERKGTKRASQYGILLTALIPAMALIVPQILPDGEWAAWAYGLVFFANSAAMSSYLPGWTAYLLELAPEAERPLYVGLTNTLNGITTLFSTVGGLLLQWTGNNYRLLFIVTILGTLAALPLSARMPEPRTMDVVNPSRAET